jgi:hypothetical protein
MKQDRKTVRSGNPDDPVDVDLFSKKTRLVGPFRIVRTLTV